MRAIKISLGALVLFCGAATAADATLEVARRCVQLTDSLQRLVCFDRAFAAAPAPAPAAAVGPAPAVAPVAAATPAAVVPSLGDESLRRRTRGADASNAPTSLAATVTALRETRQNVFRVTLDNGQVWQQMDLEDRFYLEVGDQVQVEKGLMGGYRMAKVAPKRSGWARVTRIK